MGNPALFEARGGISIGVHFLSGDGVPGGAGGRPDDAVKGSVYLDSTNGAFYLKKTSGTGADKWVRMQGQDDLNAALLGQSWREPVKVYSGIVYADLAAAETEVNTGSLLGVSLAEGDRILFTNITGANANVFIVTGTPGSGATLVEDGNTVSRGDALYVQEGPNAGQQFVFNGSGWVQQGAASATEISYLQSFVGKSGNGNELPDYSSTNVITDNDSLETAIGKIDTTLGSTTDLGTLSTRTWETVGTNGTIATVIGTLDRAIGDDPASVNIVSTGQSVNANISALDAAIGADVATPQARTAGPISSQAANLNIEALDDAIGPNVTSNKWASSGFSVNVNLSKLDEGLAKARTEKETNSITAPTVVDSVLVDECTAVEWTIFARSRTTPGNAWTAKILAIHNGTIDSVGAQDATTVEYNTFSVLKLGGNISQLEFDVDLSGSGTSQLIRLIGTSGENTRVTVTRSILLMSGLPPV